MFDHIAEFVVARRRAILCAVAVVFVVCGVTAPNVDFDFTPQELFESTDDAHEYREVFAERFGREDNVVTILVEGDDLFAPDVLGPMRDLTYELRRHEAIVDAHSLATLSLPRPDSISAEPHLGDPRDGDDDGPVRGPDVDPRQAEQLAEYARNQPLIANRLVDEDGDTGLIAVWISPEIQDATDLADVLGEVEEIIGSYEFPDDVSVDPQGIPAMRVTIVDQLRSEQLFFIPLTAFIYLIVLLVLFRRASGIVLPLGTVVFALAMTLTLMVVTDSSINIINNVLPTLIFVIGISDSIHMITRHAEEVELGKSHHEAVEAMVRHTGAACLLTTSTTAVGFLSLLAADTAILRSFGWQAAAGVMLAYVATILFLSAALTYMKPASRSGATRSSDEPGWIERVLMRIGDKILARPWTTVTVSLLLAGTVAFQARHVDVDTHIMDILSEDHPTHRATETIEDDLGGVLPLELSLEAGEDDTFRRPEIYRAVHRLQQFAARQPTVLSTESYIDHLQTARVAVTGDPDQRDQMPETRDEIEQLLVLIADAPDADDNLSDFVTGDYQYARILTRVEGAGANSHLQLANRLESKIEELFGDNDDITVHITGDAYVASAALDAFVRDLTISLGIAIVIIFGMMMIVFRSVKIGVVSLLPNVLPLAITLGYMGWADINLDSTTTTIFAIGLGIAVDDSIHFFARFVEERKRRDDLREAILQTYNGAGRAILMTSILLLIGMGIIQFSEFVPTQQFSTLIGMIIAGAILADLFLLPAILYLVYSKFPGDQKQSAPLRQREPADESSPDDSADAADGTTG